MQSASPGSDEDQRLRLSGVTWRQYEILRATLDDFPGLRMTYLEGMLEITSPSSGHEVTKKCIARLLEVYAMAKRLPLNGGGSTTYKNEAMERGLEPDECYALGRLGDVPDIAIEVEWSKGGIDKLEVYRGLHVPEVWMWQRTKGRIVIHQLQGGAYVVVPRSRFLPDLDVDMLLRYVRPDAQTEAAAEYFEALAQG
jgi:Uma2 family endonuclease